MSAAAGRPSAGCSSSLFSLRSLGRFAFYDAACSPDMTLVIATGERRVYTGILLTIRGVPPE